MIKLNQKNVSQKFITERYLQNEDYFSLGNKRFFNVEKTECYEIGEFFGVVIEHQGEFLRGTENKHVVLKMVSHDRKITTVSSGFSGSKNGLYLYRDIRDFLKSSLGFYEKNVISKLESISLSDDYKNTLLFKNFNNEGFYLSFNDDIKIISHL